MRDVLLERAYPEAYLDSLAEDQLTNLYDFVLEKDAYFYSWETNVANDGNVQPLGNIPTDELTFDTVLSLKTEKVSGVTYIAEVYVTLTYKWTKLPFMRDNDAIAINWDSNKLVYDSDSFVAHTEYLRPSNSTWVKTTLSKPASLKQGGLGFFVDLRYSEHMMGTTVQAIGFRGDAYFTLLPDPLDSMEHLPSYPNGSSTTINAEYVHNKNTLASLSFTASGVSVSITPRSSVDTRATSSTLRYTPHK